MMRTSERERIPTIAERVTELLEDVPPLTDEQNRAAARLWLAAKRSAQGATDAA